MIVCLLRWGEFTSRRLFLGLDDRDPLERKALEAAILIETTPAPKGRAGQLCAAFIRHRVPIGAAQATNVTGRIDHQEVFDRVAWLSCRCSSPVVPLDRPGGGSDARCHPANKGGRHIRRPADREHRGALVGVAGGQQLLMCSSVIQHGMQEMHLRMRIRLRHATELSLHLLDGMLCYIGEHE